MWKQIEQRDETHSCESSPNKSACPQLYNCVSGLMYTVQRIVESTLDVCVAAVADMT